MKLNIGQVLQEGWEAIIKNPTILLVAFAGVLICEVSVLLDQLVSLAVCPIMYLFAFFWMTQYVYEALHGKPSWDRAFRALLPKWPALIVSTVFFFTAVFAGMIFLIVPGVLVLVRWGAYDYAIMFDGAGIFDGFKKSWALTEGSFWRVLAVMLVLFLPSIVSEFIPRKDLFLAANMFVQTFFQAWWTSTMVLVYVHLKRIRENPGV